MQEAADKLNIGVTTLKKLCRDLGLSRWPFRKNTSMERLLEKSKELCDVSGQLAQLQQNPEACR